MKFAALGRTHWLMDATRLAMSRGHQLVFVGTCAAAPEYRVKEADFERLAAEAGCPYFSDARVNDERHVRAAGVSGAEIAISVNWLTLFGSQMIAAFPHGILNAHAGDLPRYRGNACPNWAILNGEDHVGACVHQVIPDLDAGPVVLRSSFPLGPQTYIGDVYAFLDREFPRLLVDGIEGLLEGRIKPEPQPTDPALSLRCFPRTPEDGLIDWRQSAEQVCSLVRASAEPFAGAYTYFNGELLRVWRARVARLPYPWTGVPGQIAAISGGDVTVLCGKDVIVISEVQLGGERIPPGQRITSLRMRLGAPVSKGKNI
jgi:methionyl-tRNA formyltransferase